MIKHFMKFWPMHLETYKKNKWSTNEKIIKALLNVVIYVNNPKESFQ